MFFKRLGVLKTKNMMKIFDKFTVNDELKALLEQNQEDAEDFRRIEIVSKQALGKLSSKTDEIELAGTDQRQGDCQSRRDYLVDRLINNAVGIDVKFSIIKCVAEYDKIEVKSAPKSCRDDINQLYAAAKNEKRRLKLIQKKIRDDLKKWESYHKKASVLVDKLKTYNWRGTIGGASSTDTYSQYMSKSDLKIMAKCTEQYNTLCGDMIELKEKISQLLKDAGRDEKSVANALKDIKYPELDAGHDDVKSFEETFEKKILRGDKGQIQDFVKRYQEYKEFCGDPKYSGEYPKTASFDDFFAREKGKNKTKYEGTFTINGQDIK